MTAPESLLRTPLYHRHAAMGARLVEFGGWEMPVQYSGIVDEHQAVRNAAGLFDISHMGEVEVSGPEALNYLQYVTTQDIAALETGQATYALLCQPDGGIVDDIFVYRLMDRYLVVVNASNTAKDIEWMLEHTNQFDVELQNISPELTMLALQGPSAEAILAQATDANVVNLPFHAVTSGNVLANVPVLIARTGYTGEDGFELFTENSYAEQLWDGLLELGNDAGIKPCGLGARDSLRFEACLALYGHEIGADINPYEAKLGWVVKLDKGDFIGREALQKIKQEGVTRRLVGFEMVGRGIARGEYAIHSIDDKPIGTVTTGMPAPSIGKNLGLGFVPIALAKTDSELDIIVRNKPVRARVVKTPFYQTRYKKS